MQTSRDMEALKGCLVLAQEVRRAASPGRQLDIPNRSAILTCSQRQSIQVLQKPAAGITRSQKLAVLKTKMHDQKTAMSVLKLLFMPAGSQQGRSCALSSQSARKVSQEAFVTPAERPGSVQDWPWVQSYHAMGD